MNSTATRDRHAHPSRRTWTLALALLTTPLWASAESWLTFGFTDMSAEFTGTGPGAGVLSVSSANVALGGAFNTGGDVTRLFPPSSVAEFNTGFFGNGTNGDFLFTLQLNDITDESAEASGNFVLTDANGDTITGGITGTWTLLGGFAAFDGLLSGVTLTNNSGDGTFNGASFGSFDMQLPDGPTYPGAFAALVTGEWFDADFTAANVLQQAAVVPEPAALGLAAVAAFAFRRRRA